MLTKQVIAALTEAAGATSAVDALRALAYARHLLGVNADACEPLFHELARRCDKTLMVVDGRMVDPGRPLP